MRKAATALKRNTWLTLPCILLGLNAIGYAMEALKALWGIAGSPGPLLPLMAGVGLGAFWMSKRQRGTWDVLEHEVEHGLWSELAGSKVRQIVAGDQPMDPSSPGGSRRLGYCRSQKGIQGVLGNCWILGPYFFPAFTVLLLLIRLTLGENVPGLFDLLVGFSLGYHLASHWEQIPNAIRVAHKDSRKESDFARFGVPFSLAFVVMAHWIIIPSVLLVVHGGWMSAARYVVAGQGFWVELIIN